MNNEISVVISVCAIKDIVTWQAASNYIVKHIAAQNYLVVVPDDDVTAFKAVSNARYQVHAESQYVADISPYLKEKIMPTKNAWRYGWYLQQLIKLSALEKSLDDGNLLIWDADTIPLKPLQFTTDKGRIKHYRGAWLHEPYFKNIKTLLDIDRQVDYSFIAQCFAIKSPWLKGFFDELERRHNKNWKRAIVDNIDFEESSGFSEYEVLGNYLMANHRQDFVLNDRSWLHHGRSEIGEVANLEDPLIIERLKSYDFAAFEHWDKISWKRKWKKIKRKLKRWRQKYLKIKRG